MKWLFSVILSLGIVLPLQAKSDRQIIAKGNEHYKDQQWEEAITQYKRALDQSEEPTLPALNLGDAHYRLKNFPEAAAEYQRATRSEDPDVRQSAWFNLGNASLAAQDLKTAVRSYREALKLDPTDMEARYNLEQALIQQQQQQQQQNESCDNDQDQKQNQDSEQQQNENQKQQQQTENQQQQENQDQQQAEESQSQNKQTVGEQQQQTGETSADEPEEMASEEITRMQQEQLMQALQQDEENILKEILKAKMPQGKKVEKDW